MIECNFFFECSVKVWWYYITNWQGFWSIYCWLPIIVLIILAPSTLKYIWNELKKELKNDG